MMDHEIARATTPIRLTAGIVGVVFLLLGIAGFIPGVTTNLDQLKWAGDASAAMLFGLFQTSVLHNAINLLFGVVGVASAPFPRVARQYLFWGGVVQVIIWVFGLYAADQPGANFLPIDNAGVWLHLGMAVVMILLGLFVGRDRSRRSVGSHRVGE